MKTLKNGTKVKFKIGLEHTKYAHGIVDYMENSTSGIIRKAYSALSYIVDIGDKGIWRYSRLDFKPPYQCSPLTKTYYINPYSEDKIIAYFDKDAIYATKYGIEISYSNLLYILSVIK